MFGAEEVEDGGGVGGVEEGFEEVVLGEDGIGEVGGAGEFGVEGWGCGVECYGLLVVGGMRLRGGL